MRTFAICGRAIPATLVHGDSAQAMAIDGAQIMCGIIETADRALDRTSDATAHNVLVHVRGFSCNYRDKTFILRAAARLPRNKFFVIGSEFVGDVVAVGRAVRRVRPGDRVIGDNSYPHLGPGDPPATPHPGVPTNGASGEYLVLHEEKVIPVPASMPDDVAAAFSLGAQTAFSMVAKLAPQSGERMLVTSARANTSLFAIQALCERGVEVHVTTTSERSVEQLRAHGARHVFVVERGASFSTHEALAATTRSIGGFTGVIDPFFDVNLLNVLPLMRNGGRYVTCGFRDQIGIAPDGTTMPAANYQIVMCTAMVRNIAIIGNCMGLRRDLERALATYETGRLHVAIDSVVDGNRTGEFLARTFVAPDRFGKVVYAYN